MQIELRSTLGLMTVQSLPGVGQLTALRLAQYFDAVVPSLERHERLWERAEAAAREELARCRERGVAVISIFDPSYPRRLREIASPPALLYVLGDTALLGREQLVAVSGTVKPSDFGAAATRRVVSYLAGSEWGLVGSLSGGVSRVACETACAQQTPVLAVLGGGIAASISPGKREVAERIVGNGGAVIGTLPMDVKAVRGGALDFLRVSAALGVAVAMSEARLPDASLALVREAVQQGRPVFCVPPPERPRGEDEKSLEVLLGVPAERLIEEGAKWKSTEALLMMLGEEPLAQPVPDDRADFLSSLERLLEIEREDPRPPQWQFGSERAAGAEGPPASPVSWADRQPGAPVARAM